jgi:hypothetical protein
MSQAPSPAPAPGPPPRPGGSSGLIAALVLGAVLRLAGIGWGVPRYDGGLAQGTALRTSYHLDEDKVLWPLALGRE